MTYRLIKRSGWLIIETESGEVFYSPPDFLRPFIHGRQAMNELVEALNTTTGPPIRLIVAFETAMRPCIKR